MENPCKYWRLDVFYEKSEYSATWKRGAILIQKTPQPAWLQGEISIFSGIYRL